MIFDPSKLSRAKKSALIFGTDLLLLPIAFWAAFGFRLGIFDADGWLGLFNPFERVEILDSLFVLGACGLLLFFFKLHRIKMHAIDLDAIFRIAGFSLSIMLLASVGAFFLQAGFPRSVPIYFGAIFFILAIITRLIALRLLQALSVLGENRVPVAIYGAGSAGIQLAASLKQSREVVPVMFVDDNPALHNLIVSGTRVKPPSVLEKAAQTGRIRQVLIAIPSLSISRKAEMIERLKAIGCDVKVVPSYVDLVSGKNTVSDLRTVTTDELLGRDRVDLNTPEITEAYTGRCVMVTGAGGSIGAELCLQLLNCQPSKIVLFERSEPALYEINRLIKPGSGERGVAVESCLGSITDLTAIQAVLKQHSVDVVLHAAAYKHVPIIEENEVEGARNNVLGTKIVCDAAVAANVERFILISTDKAVRPTNIMGATKRLAELVVSDAQRRCQTTRFSMVRFGNVLGSSGSVVPLFTKQIADGGPVTVTHPQVTRFFMTIPEAARLVLLAGAYAEGNDLFVLDMGEPIKIMDLARRMIELSGRTLRDAVHPDGDIEIELIGMRPGEKLYEELLIDNKTLIKTPHEKILRAQESGQPESETKSMLEQVSLAVERRDRALVRAVARNYVTGFHSNQTGEHTLIQFPGQKQPA
ncbi:MAG: polysaccharide biosynthesis protein [Rhizobiales bacterium]|nr:polysaccharide biosynthesis protein [Hyphomicrobiales bacterium]MBO6698951.1 polysaccharide biosynthesis protein [Hyphomicrobiales bacterium]MBO6734796.1 polysaccharide biosynthesis protein [Hyphomicrobiales bacterium]MBO6911398.1 polysaccharide biosynthesis protein [Hyphomicrobiales bacterium]MBO6955469.1 polysaccharide biosynthesis protein [Hyphomicrobiales bacterium]